MAYYLNAEIDSLKAEQKEIMRDIRNLEMRTTVNEKDIATINKQLEKISANTTWILRIIISAIVMSKRDDLILRNRTI
ncbi:MULTISPECIES: hemolysin XhlA family protein [Bacillus]|uniref:hemolysin XhlA family protein n=1 Tax=Bacillus TaxID=1386 RepID=UPI00211D9075|nr:MULTISPECIES: hemolysin XhlA family protein [Bacillus]MCU0095925.1 hemolysin XhlA family protein [Bacillus sp. OR9]MCU4758101.1 hemolysin XhlA family protein [Bacillus cereus]MCU5107423.1 hemolysin XhlA family protein [Bacillus cereus]MCU5342168.1 hemolysin XhlA family protein [Bacillus cereus]MDF2021108.1 hemolysin XhlA family protein [Bacillus sp. Cr_R3]